MRESRGCLWILLIAAAVPAQSTLPQSELSSARPTNVDGSTDLAAIRAATEAGLAFLAHTQTPGGYWTGHVGHKQGDSYRVLTWEEEQRARGQGHLGVSALAGLAFLAGGHLPGRGKYGDHVAKTLTYILAHRGENGFLTDSGTRMYSHAFATLFLAEVYGMAGGKHVKAGLERAVHWITDCQNHQGGWRYNPFTQEADMSVTVCQLQALRAAHNIGIQVSARTIAAAVAYVRRARTESGPMEGLFYYKTEGRGAWRKNREYAINAAALTALFSAGVHDAAAYEPVLDFLTAEYPFLEERYPTHFYYWYGNYYACQAFFQAGEKPFAEYYRRISRDLLRSQRPDGRWLNDVGPGDILGTAVATMILEIPFQFLPIFQR